MIRMFVLAKELLDKIFEYGVVAYPHETCGLLLGRSKDGVWEVLRVLPASNTNERTLDRYRLDPLERLRAEETALKEGLQLIGFYHSHPDHDAYFSQTDLENSEEYQFGKPWTAPTYAYFVVSIQKAKPNGYGAFIVSEGSSQALSLKVLPGYSNLRSVTTGGAM